MSSSAEPTSLKRFTAVPTKLMAAAVNTFSGVTADKIGAVHPVVVAVRFATISPAIGLQGLHKKTESGKRVSGFRLSVASV